MGTNGPTSERDHADTSAAYSPAGGIGCHREGFVCQFVGIHLLGIRELFHMLHLCDVVSSSRVRVSIERTLTDFFSEGILNTYD